MCKQTAGGKLLPIAQEARSVPCDDLQGWDGGWKGGSLKGGDIYIRIADSLHGTVDTNTTLERNYTQ